LKGFGGRRLCRRQRGLPRLTLFQKVPPRKQEKTMFKLFSKKSKNPNSKQYRWEMARQMANHHIRYVTEKINDVDEVIGRNGGLNIKDDEMLVFASSDVIFRCKIEQMQAWELLSKDGVVITAPDLEHGGRERTIIVFYVYYR
jgi:hypothetical protein